MSVSDDIIDQYLETAAWAETDNSDDSGGDPLDANYSIDDFTQAARNQARVELNQFEEEMDRVLDALGDAQFDLDTSSWPHDFWLSRNGHGSGFFDKPERYGDAADALQVVAQRQGSRDVSVDVPYDNEEEAPPELSFFPVMRSGG